MTSTLPATSPCPAGSCSGLAGGHGVHLSAPEPDGSLSTGNPCWGFDKAPQFVTPRVDKNLKLDATKKFDREQLAVRTPGCQTNSNIVATRAIHATLRVGSGSVPESDPVRTGPTSTEVQKAFATSDLLTCSCARRCRAAMSVSGLAPRYGRRRSAAPSSAALVPAYVLISYGSHRASPRQADHRRRHDRE